MSAEELAAAGVANPILAEVSEMLYALEHPYILDSSETEKTFGLESTRLDDVLIETVDAFAASRAEAQRSHG